MINVKTIYCDFDGTITKKDAVNSFFELYASPEWLDSEQLWIDGEISSMENAICQVGLLPKLSGQKVQDYIESIEIDDYFVEFCQFLKRSNINLVILSDGFDLFIQKILEKNEIENVKFYANHFLHNEDGSFSIEFPFYNPVCEKKAGMCKCAMVKEKDFCYIGDGTSDLCIAKKAKFLFATKSLKDYCKKHSLSYYPFDSFKDIIELFKKDEE